MVVIGRWSAILIAVLALAMPASAALAAPAPGAAVTLMPKPRPPETGRPTTGEVQALPRPRPAAAERQPLARWALADRGPREPSPQPGEWTTSIVPDIEIGGDDDGLEPVGNLGAIMAPLGLEQLLLRLTHHF